MNEEIIKRKVKGLSRALGIRNLKKPNFVEYIETGPLQGQIKAVFCRICGMAIKTLIRGEEPLDSKEINGKTVVYLPVMLAETSNYAEATLDFDDGSKHIVALCLGCAKGAKASILEEVYAADLMQWEQEERKGGGEVCWTDSLVNRTPTKVSEIRTLNR